MKFVSVQSVTATAEAGVYEMIIIARDGEGDPEELPFIYRPEAETGFSAAVRAWLGENQGQFTITPHVPPVARLTPLTARQFRLGLIEAGRSPDQVAAAIEGLPSGPDKEKAKIEWEYATTFNRTHPLIATVGGALGLSDQQIDAMWLAAVSL